MKKKIVSLVLAFTILLLAVMQVSALRLISSKEVPINGTAESTIITATVPTSMSFSIDPNADTPFVSVPANVVNMSAAKLDVELVSILPTGNSAPYPSPEIVAPDSVDDWSQLGVLDTETKIALGLKSVNGTTVWAPAESAASEESAGTIMTVRPQAAEPILLDCKHGMSWSAKHTMDYTLILQIVLTED